jgi:hypothetical protein
MKYRGSPIGSCLAMTRRCAAIVLALARCSSDSPATAADLGVLADLEPDVTYPVDGGKTSCDRPAPLLCGASATGNNSTGANWIDLYGCATAPNSGPEVTYAFRDADPQVVTVDLTPFDASQDLDLFVLGADCSAKTCVSQSLRSGGEAEQVRFLAAADQDFRIVVDGYLPGPGDGAGAFQIAATCAPTACAPAAAATLDCSTTALAGHNGQAGSTDRHDLYGCGHAVLAREYVYRFDSAETGRVTISLDIVEPSRDLDLVVLEDRGGGCDVGACMAASTTRFDEVVSFDAVAGTTYYVVVDGVSDAPETGIDVGAYAITVTCPVPDGGPPDASSD